MAWELNSDRPIYLQAVEYIEKQIILGEYHLGDKLPSVRNLASEAAVNPNTMQKALLELEQKGLIYAQRTSGRFITEDKQLVEKLRIDQAKQNIEQFLEKMLNLGFNKQQIMDLLRSED
jgi:GntR family transcriptional regulator